MSYWRDIFPHEPIMEFVDKSVIREFHMVDDIQEYITMEKLKVASLNIRTKHGLWKYDISISLNKDKVFLRRELFVFDQSGNVSHEEEEIWVADMRRLNDGLLTIPAMVTMDVRRGEVVFRIRGYGTVFVEGAGI